ncbi:conserved hypothetical protein [Streptomyces sviceus ATCC 29083]|uniref:Uncharacterized protein n=1 Tax=Streptomyces sviceus (strain ATCC 29083 / DSM 924 / JCM 4929 / NBRC 13980 / NCIMB 11184 / NRRL 5439 / UC 5370) TaxID=463191 RepID=B5HQA9_STRX2|nr:conserved hypothetical protein [Streptomyces sviceus ATCC 29083]
MSGAHTPQAAGAGRTTRLGTPEGALSLVREGTREVEEAPPRRPRGQTSPAARTRGRQGGPAHTRQAARTDRAPHRRTPGPCRPYPRTAGWTRPAPRRPRGPTGLPVAGHRSPAPPYTRTAGRTGQPYAAGRGGGPDDPP